MSFLSVLATVAGSAMALSNITQAHKIFRRKSAKDISIVTYSTLLAGTVVWVAYGFEIGNFPVIVSNIVGFVSISIVIAGWFLYK